MKQPIINLVIKTEIISSNRMETQDTKNCEIYEGTLSLSCPRTFDTITISYYTTIIVCKYI